MPMFANNWWRRFHECDPFLFGVAFARFGQKTGRCRPHRAFHEIWVFPAIFQRAFVIHALQKSTSVVEGAIFRSVVYILVTSRCGRPCCQPRKEVVKIRSPFPG